MLTSYRVRILWFTLLLMAALLSACSGSPVQPSAQTQPPAQTQAAQPVVAPAETVSPETETWLKAAQLGPYTPEKQDWAAIEAAAKKEGKLVVYFPSAPYKAGSVAFQKKYPEIQVDGYELSMSAMNQRLREEQKAGVYNADVYINPDFGEGVSEFVPLGYLRNFIPDSIKDRLPEQYQQPILIRATSGRVFYYNSEINDKCPISNWWDLTESAWKGKLVSADPSNDIAGLAFFTMVTLKGDEMAQAYQEKYGQPPKLDADTPNAGYLWVKRIGANEPVLTTSQKTVESVGTKGMKEAPISISPYFFNYLGVSGQLAIKPCLGLKPVIGVLSQNVLAIVNRAPHPNAAKLFVREALENPDVSGKMLQSGSYPTVKGEPEPKGNIPYDEMIKLTWLNDRVGIYQNMPKVQEFWLQVTAK
jgi:iron(III) transport system substrate-binding protein